MARPSKAAAVLAQEGKSHRTKAEMEQRKSAEQAVLTGQKLKEQVDVRADAVAHAEFRRVLKIMAAIGKNDALYNAGINRYCKLHAETLRLEASIRQFETMENELDSADMPARDRYKTAIELRQTIQNIDRQLQTKRKMMMDTEKEYGMTMASALRIIPKEPEKKKNPLLEVLQGGED